MGRNHTPRPPFRQKSAQAPWNGAMELTDNFYIYFVLILAVLAMIATLYWFGF